MAELYTVTFTDSATGAEQQTAGRVKTLELLERLSILEATAVLVQAPNGEQWSGEEALRLLVAR